MKPKSVVPDPTAVAILPGANFMDAYVLATPETSIDATRAARSMFGRMPGWVRALLQLRDVIVAPFRLRLAEDLRTGKEKRIGIFPIVSQTPHRIVLGLDDRHLDFRVLVDVRARADQGQDVTLTTLVETHNWGGRLYLMMIYPFHVLISRHSLSQLGTLETSHRGPK